MICNQKAIKTIFTKFRIILILYSEVALSDEIKFNKASVKKAIGIIMKSLVKKKISTILW